MRIFIVGILIALMAGCANAELQTAVQDSGVNESHSPKNISVSGEQKTEPQKPIPQKPPSVSEVIPIAQAHKEANNGGNKQQDKTEGNWSLSDKIAAIASVAAFLQFVALAVTIWVMRGSAVRQLRAYVLVQGIEILDFEIGKQPRARVTIKNFGQTPAKNFRQWATMGFDVFPPSLSNPIVKNDPMHTHPPAPSGIIYMPAKFNRVLQDFEVAGINKGEVALYVVGEIFYDDAFGKNRVTKYKFFANGTTDISNGYASATKEGNDYT